MKGCEGIANVRIPIGLILGYLAMGKTFEEIIDEIPDLNKEQIFSELKFPSSRKWISSRKIFSLS